MHLFPSADNVEPAMSMSSIRGVNSNAEMVSKGHALAMNIASAKGLQDVVKTNLGPKGTLKMCELPAPIPSLQPVILMRPSLPARQARRRIGRH